MTEAFYLFLYPLFRPFLGRLRRKSSVRFKKLSNHLFLAFDHTSSQYIFFSSLKRCRLYFHPSGIENRLNYLRQKYTDDRLSISREDVVFDVGANIGEFSLVAASVSKHVYAFEPDETCKPALCFNANLNFAVFNFGLSDKTASLPFYISNSEADSSLIKPSAFTMVKFLRFQTLNDFCCSNNLFPTFLKIEAEGAEPEVLKGATTLLTRPLKIAIDVSPERYGKSTSLEVQNILCQYGFECWQRGFTLFALKTEV